MGKIRLALNVPISDDPTSWYRGFGPLSALQKMMPDLEFGFPPANNWAAVKLSDAIFMQRPHLPEQHQAMAIAKEMGKPVWIDFDDDNLACPEDNPAYSMYCQWPIKDSIVKMARLADVISVSTERLRKRYSIYNKNVIVIPNALDDLLLPIRKIPERPREKMAMWRGSASHDFNLETVASSIVNLAKKHEDWKFAFFGHNPLMITKQFKNKQIIGHGSILDYYKAMCGLHPSLVYYPLASNDHAQARSHVVYLESTFGAAQLIAYRNEEFTKPGILNFSTPQEFEDVMTSVIKGEVDIDKNVNEAWAYIQENYLLSKVNLLRKQIVEQLSNRL